MIDSRLAEIVADWVWGWTLSRGTPDPVPEPDGYRIDVGLPGHRVRYVLPDPGSTGSRAAGLTAPGTWLKVCGTPEQVALSPEWTIGAPEYLMSKELAAPEPITPPDPYTVELCSDGDVHVATVRAGDGGSAAKGRVAVRGRAAVFDVVETDPAHRRRGLGSVVMSELSCVASNRRGVLLASEAGRALYERLGWAVESPVTAAHLAG
jgi:GNAT superfamily N-acetyltransferase